MSMLPLMPYYDPGTCASATWDVWAAGQLSQAQIQQRAERRLRELVQYARQFSPFHQRLYRTLARSEELTLQELPILTRRELMENFDDWATDRHVTRAAVERFIADREAVGEPFLGRYAVWCSSGTGGEPGICLHDGPALAVYDALEALRFRGLGSLATLAVRFMTGERYAMVAATGGHFAGVASIERLRRQSPWLAPNVQVFSILQPIDALVETLNRYQPTILALYPTAASVLADEQEQGRLRLRLAELWSGGETLVPSSRERLARVFGCKVRNAYGATEFISIAWECDCDRLHVNADWVMLEPVDERLQPVKPDVPSNTVLLTNLANRVQPIIRCDLGDSITLLDGPCPCGSALPSIRVEGRHDDILTFADAGGRNIKLLPLALETVMEEEAGVHEYQILGASAEEMHVRIGAAARAEHGWPAVEGALREYLQRQGLFNVRVVLDERAPAREPASGKARRVIAAVRVPSA